MKKFIIAAVLTVCVLLIADVVYYQLGFYIDFHPDRPVTTFTSVDGKTILVDGGEGPEPFEIRGVNMGVGIPGHFATDYAIDKKTYLRWFRYIKEMGANTLRVYTILGDDFYDAFYEFNRESDEPLYLIHGVWVDDYVQNSRADAYDKEFLEAFERDCRTVADIIHGEKKVYLGEGAGSGFYRRDISPWVIGYILGVEWEDVTVAYTDHRLPELHSYQGEYMYTAEDATPFEAMLARVGDALIAYESRRYKQQRLVAFSNWPATDPFDYPVNISTYFLKFAKVDAEHIKTTDRFLAGQFASYHIYPYYPDYLNYSPEAESFMDETGKKNTYQAYLKKINSHHRLPVVISEFGVPSSRGMAQKDQNTGRNQGRMSETEQGQALAACYEDIREAGCAGSVIFTWQDEWFKRTWNTMGAVDLLRTPYWSDYQTNEQYFGLLAFDPGRKRSVCYVDGDASEWKEEDRVGLSADGSLAVSMKYDEKYLYYLVEAVEPGTSADRFFLSVDTTQKTGSTYCENLDLKFNRGADFVVVVDGEENSRVLVQERYEAVRAMFSHEIHGVEEDAYENPPDKNTPVFQPINMLLQTATPLLYNDSARLAEVYETGKLTCGNGNPQSSDFNSLADFCAGSGFTELRLPWQLLNFSDPSRMRIHDDYYEHFGVENQEIDTMYVGVGTEEDRERRIPLQPVKLEGWGRKVTYHERLKESYYAVQKMWARGEEEAL